MNFLPSSNHTAPDEAVKHPDQHARAPHAQWADRWNPYHKRETFTPSLDAATFNAMLGDGPELDIDPNLLCYCLDAPDEVPAGSTLRIHTIGGFEREEYNRIWREQTDWKAAARGQAELAVLLKQILEEAA